MFVLARNTLSAGLATAAVSLVQMASVSASDNSGIQAECQRQAEEYGIEPEQRVEYINGCILSMGGTLSEDERPVTESEDAPDAMVAPTAEENDATQ